MTFFRILITFALSAGCLVSAARAQAQPTAGSVSLGQGNERRVALVVGNAAYRDSPLKNPVSDARAMRDKLKGLGFEIAYFENLKTRQIGSALREFRNLIKPGSVALFFYAGHGLQVRGENYLPTVDAELNSEEDVPNQSLSVSAVLNTMEDSKAAVNLVLLDACRNNPYARSFRSAPSGLARVQAPSGTLIHYATRPGSVAEDGSGAHGTYTEALLAQIDEKGVPIETALKRVTIRVRDATKGKQEPWMEGSLTGDFYFTVNGNPQITIQQAPNNADAAAWQAAESSNTPAAYQAYLGEFPNGLYAAAARIKLASLKQATAPVPVPAVPQPPAPQAAVVEGGAAPALAAPPAGTKDPEGYVWRDVQAQDRREAFQAYLQQFPKGRFAVQARAALRRIAQREAEQRALAEPQVWEAARQGRTEDGYLAYLQEFPKGRFVAQANDALKALRQEAASGQAVGAAPRPATEEPRRPAQERSSSASEREALRTAALRELSLARITAGEFVMGADAEEVGEGGTPDESAQPQRPVKVAAFEMAYYELTVGQFRKFADATGYLTEAENAASPGCNVPVRGGSWALRPGTHWRAPGYPQTDGHPVVCVSWNDVQAYLQWLNGGTEQYRLPSEAEWEFAARAGTTTPRPWSDIGGFWSRTWDRVKPGTAGDQPPSRTCKYANVSDESLRTELDWTPSFNCRDGYPYAVPGGYYSRNNFGLYDMMGNAGEWTQDCWNPSHAGAPRDSRIRTVGDCGRHVVRGGSWASSPAFVRSAARLSQAQSYRASDLGFRLARAARP
jgi:formylglycine-generating enzyme required for sulfatase activity/uncharacterized caspase-like protein